MLLHHSLWVGSPILKYSFNPLQLAPSTTAKIHQSLIARAGPYGCIGKQLALMELRTVITLLVLNFNVSFAPEEDGNRLFRDTKDIFTLELGELKLAFERIEKA